MESNAGAKSSCSFCLSRDCYDFDCNICYELPTEPIVTLCGHLYCRACLSKWLHVHSSYTHIKKCPTCQAPIRENTLIPLYGKGMRSSTGSRFTEHRLVQHVFVTIVAFLALMYQSVTKLTSRLLQPILGLKHSATAQYLKHLVRCLLQRLHDFENKIFALTAKVCHSYQCLFHELRNQIYGLPLEGKRFILCLMDLIQDLPNKIFTTRTGLDSPPCRAQILSDDLVEMTRSCSKLKKTRTKFSVWLSRWTVPPTHKLTTLQVDTLSSAQSCPYDYYK